MTLQINFIRDVASRCLEELARAGYSPNPSGDENAIYTYFSIRHRRVRSQCRTVHKADYDVPEHLVAGEQQFLAKVAAGGDLWPHQSRKIGNLSIEDGMLNDYGIQHFHLGVVHDPHRPQLITGTKELLYAIVRDHDFYAIGIDDHNCWTKRALVDTVHKTWPNLTEPYTFKGVQGLTRIHTDDEVKRLRSAGINISQQRPDGKVQIGMGGGVAANGSSIAVRLQTDVFIDDVKELEQEVAAVLEPYVRMGHLPDNAPVHVVWDKDKIYAVPTPTVVNCNITDLLVIPPL